MGGEGESESESESGTSPRSWSLDLVRFGLLVVAVCMHGLVAVSVTQSYGTDEFSRRDWWAFREAGRQVLDGELSGLYDARPGGFPFLHPPYVAAVLAPAGRLGDAGFYGLMLALQGLGLGAAWLALRRLRGRTETRDVLLLGALASAPWSIGLLLGQPSALWLGAWLVALLALERGRPISAGLLFGLCALKPPYLLAPILYALLWRRYRVLGGIAVSVALLLLLGTFVGQWAPWAGSVGRTLGDVSAGELALWKQHTLLASLRGVMPRIPAFAIWGAATVAVVARLYALRRVGTPMVRVLGWMALATIALSPFAYFYDALLLALPAAALCFRPECYPRRSRLALGTVACVTLGVQTLQFFVVQCGPPVLGWLVAAWLGLELFGARPVKSS